MTVTTVVLIVVLAATLVAYGASVWVSLQPPQTPRVKPESSPKAS